MTTENPYQAPMEENSRPVWTRPVTWSVLSLALGIVAFVFNGMGNFTRPSPFLCGFIFSALGIAVGVLALLLQVGKRYSIVVALLFNGVLVWKSLSRMLDALSWTGGHWRW